MKKIKKYWWLWLVVLVVILLIVLLVVKGSDSQQSYVETGDGPHLQGSPEASVSLLEYSDFQCPACAGAFSVVKDITEKYGDKIKFEFRHFPLTSIHRYAYNAAEASECASDQGKFWEYHDLLFLNQNKLTKSDLRQYASQLEGLDMSLWEQCLASGVKAKRVDQDLAQAEKEGYNATPTFILNGQKVEDWAMLDKMIQSLIEPLVPLQSAN